MQTNDEILSTKYNDISVTYVFLHNSQLSEGDFLDDIHACVLLMTLILSKPQLKAICHVLWTTDEIKET